MSKLPELDVIFLCGGYGSRMGEITEKKQKVMLPFRDKPILQYGIESVNEAFRDVNIYLAIGHLGNQISEYFGDKWGDKPLNYIYHQPGTEDRGALLSIKNKLSGRPFMIIHGNIVYDAKSLVQNYEYQLKERPLSTLSLATKSNESKHALVKVENNKIKKISIPDPHDSSYDLNHHNIDTYDDSKEKRLMSESWLRDMGINSYSPEIISKLQNHNETYMTHLFWILVSEFQGGANLGGVVQESDWYHFQEPIDLER